MFRKYKHNTQYPSNNHTIIFTTPTSRNLRKDPEIIMISGSDLIYVAIPVYLLFFFLFLSLCILIPKIMTLDVVVSTFVTTRGMLPSIMP